MGESILKFTEGKVKASKVADSIQFVASESTKSASEELTSQSVALREIVGQLAVMVDGERSMA